MSAYVFFSRGDTFRKEFACLGEVRSLIPPSVRFLALTATANVASRKAICGTLGIRNPVVISQSPNKLNIYYQVLCKDGPIDEVFATFVDEIKQKR